MYHLTIMFLMDFDVIAQVFRYRPYHELDLWILRTVIKLDM